MKKKQRKTFIGCNGFSMKNVDEKTVNNTIINILAVLPITLICYKCYFSFIYTYNSVLDKSNSFSESKTDFLVGKVICMIFCLEIVHIFLLLSHFFCNTYASVSKY